MRSMAGITSISDPHEAAKEVEPDLLALLRVELDREQVAARQPGAEGPAVGGGELGAGGVGRGGVAVGEVDVLPVEGGEERVERRRPRSASTSRCAAAAPRRGSLRTVPGTSPSPRAPPASSPSVKRICRPTQMPSTGVPRAITSRSAASTPLLAHGLGAGRHGPLPRHHHPVGGAHRGRVAGHHHPRPHLAQRVLHRAQVAGAVVDQRDGAGCAHSTPLVDGSAVPSRTVAARRARATALKVASTTWWRLRP